MNFKINIDGITDTQLEHIGDSCIKRFGLTQRGDTYYIPEAGWFSKPKVAKYYISVINSMVSHAIINAK